MKNIEFLSREEFIEHVKDLDDGHWTKDTIRNRWDYHNRVIELIKATKITNSKKVLEMGTMGVSCVKNSDTIDFTEKWDFEGKNPTYVHDARKSPWPIEDKQYDVFVALRVFQHLVPTQTEAVKQAFRISKKIILIIPEKYDNPIIPNSKGIKYNDFVSILDGVHPNVYFSTSFGSLFYWDTENPSYLNLEQIMRNIKPPKVKPKVKPKVNVPISNKIKVKKALKKILKKIKG